jgi:bifunctional non-homologous end joining protein LigD
MQQIVDSIALHSNHGGSDKVYNVQIVEASGGFVVNYQNGRRGGTLASGAKTASPVNLEKARAIFAKLVAEKQNGSSRYQVVGTQASSAATIETQKERSAWEPMLATAIDEASLAMVLSDDQYAVQEKLDGERVMIHCADDVRGINRLGFFRPLPLNIVAALRAADIPADTLLDGELVGHVYHAFDILRHDGADCTAGAFAQRHRLLVLEILRACDPLAVRAVPLYKGASKGEALAALRKANAEGVILRQLDAPYQVGRCEKLLKFKFVESATLWIDAHESERRSVHLAGFDNAGNACRTGKVTIPANYDLPPVGAVVEVQYLYAYPGTHALAQPVYRGERSDQRQADCVLSQLRYKSAQDAAA